MVWNSSCSINGDVGVSCVGELFSTGRTPKYEFKKAAISLF